MFEDLLAELQELVLSFLDVSTRISFSCVAKKYHKSFPIHDFPAYWAHKALKEGNPALFFLALENGYTPEEDDYLPAARAGLLDVIEYLYEKEVSLPNTQILEACLAFDREEVFLYLQPKVPEYFPITFSVFDLGLFPSRPWLQRDVHRKMLCPHALLAETAHARDIRLLKELLHAGLKVWSRNPILPVRSLFKNKCYAILELLLAPEDYERYKIFVLRYDALPFFERTFNVETQMNRILSYCAIYKSVNILNYIFKEHCGIAFSFPVHTTSVQILETFREYELAYSTSVDVWDYVLDTFDAALIGYFCKHHFRNDIYKSFSLDTKELKRRKLSRELLILLHKFLPNLRDKHSFYLDLLFYDEKLVLPWLWEVDKNALEKLLGSLQRESSFRFLHEQGYSFSADSLLNVTRSNLQEARKSKIIAYLYSILSPQEKEKAEAFVIKYILL